jgi:chemosensory pili system protein ChpE
MAPLLISSFILGIAFCAPPGIITTETIRRGAARGFGPALSVQFGSLIGDTTWATIALTGLAFVIQNNTARIILSLVGIVLMVKLALDAIKDAREGAHPANGTAQTSSRGDFASGAFLSLGNPMNIVFWTGLGTTVFASIAGTPQPIHFATFFTGFLGGWGSGRDVHWGSLASQQGEDEYEGDEVFQGFLRRYKSPPFEKRCELNFVWNADSIPSRVKVFCIACYQNSIIHFRSCPDNRIGQADAMLTAQLNGNIGNRHINWRNFKMAFQKIAQLLIVFLLPHQNLHPRNSADDYTFIEIKFRISFRNAVERIYDDIGVENRYHRR